MTEEEKIERIKFLETEIEAKRFQLERFLKEIENLCKELLNLKS